ncbi:hypothetical protein KHA80_00700 [Anaerobacillus sp. HL2]|nr:hypothetical protein KHA80_00700 [Anaerobacillus sp. HL2]
MRQVFFISYHLISKYRHHYNSCTPSGVKLHHLFICYYAKYPIALTITVGYRGWRKKGTKDAKHYSYLGISLGLILGTVLHFIICFNKQIRMFYTNERDVLDSFLNCNVYNHQLSDADLVADSGALRGYKDVNVTFLLAFISFWVIGLPLGYVFAILLLTRHLVIGLD